MPAPLTEEAVPCIFCLKASVGFVTYDPQRSGVPVCAACAVKLNRLRTTLQAIWGLIRTDSMNPKLVDEWRQSHTRLISQQAVAEVEELMRRPPPGSESDPEG
jgi:hypothetical protein